uniref:Uncharacterized protein n=1 Tax=Roseihalotalea indica TaxID=2867963 RepID=A0AA49GMJ5_9BACT|nr:hypothetical protein K4G66_02435 [Tunicatimonas sp. TK19036]
MSTTVSLVLATIVLLLLLFAIVFFLRQRVAFSIEDDTLVVKSPLSTKRINLEKELESWKVQQAYYLRWGRVYSINMLFAQGNRIAVSSLFNQENYNSLYHHLKSRFKSKEVPD